MTCNLRTVNSSLRTVKSFTDRTSCTDRKDIGPLSNFTSKAKRKYSNIPSVHNNMQFADRKLFMMDREELYGPYELYGP